MSKLSRKWIVQISVTLCLSFSLTFVVYAYFLPKYILYSHKSRIAHLSTKLSSMSYHQAREQSKHMEQQYPVTIVSTSLSDTNGEITRKLQEKLFQKGISLHRFWLTKETIDTIYQFGKISKIYHQNKLKTSFLVTFIRVDNYLFAIGNSISHYMDMLEMIHHFNLYMWTGTLLLLIVLSIWYTTRIVKPLAQLHDTAQKISELSFVKVDIKTGDEIESLATSMNRMSDKLQQAHQSLSAQNENLRNFIANISHELKTPLALIQVYASGINDHLDDGTYADVIQQQSMEMTTLIDRLLELSRLQIEPYELKRVEFQALLQQVLICYNPILSEKGLTLEVERRIATDVWVKADHAKLKSVLHNFMTNAIKYTIGTCIYVTIEQVVAPQDAIRFSIRNDAHIGDPTAWDFVWEPFYVIDHSRNKKYSGTGLGLSIARTILQHHHANFGLLKKQNSVEFYFILPIQHGE